MVYRGKRGKTAMPTETGPRRNESIRARELRVIDDEGNMLGILPKMDALQLAEDKGLDLVEVNPNGDPPVAKLIDYGKYKYEQKKKQQEIKKKQTVILLKEVQFRPKIDKHDFDFKIKNAKKFLEEGNKVKIVVVFRGRERAHPELGDVLVENIMKEIGELGKAESTPKLEGRRMNMVVSPVAGKQQIQKEAKKEQTDEDAVS